MEKKENKSSKTTYRTSTEAEEVNVKRDRKEKEKDEDEGSKSPRRRRRTMKTRFRNVLTKLKCSDDEEKEWIGNWSFCQLADTQFGMHEKEGWKKEIEQAHSAVRCINALRPRPRFVIVCGDLVDAFPNGPKADIKKHEDQQRDFRKVMSNISEDIPLVCVCGNHDVGNRITKDSIGRWHRSYGPDYAAYSIGGCRCIVLNSSLLAAKNPDLWTDMGEDAETQRRDAVALAAKQDAWLDGEIEHVRKMRPTHTMVFSHIPPFIYRPDEPKGYFNLAPNIRNEVVGKLKSVGTTAWFCGHFHRNAGGKDEGLEVIVTRAAGCVLPYTRAALETTSSGEKIALGLNGLDFPKRRCGSDVSGFRLVSVTRERVAHRFFTMSELGCRIDGGDASAAALVGTAGESAHVPRRTENRNILGRKTNEGKCLVS